MTQYVVLCLCGPLMVLSLTGPINYYFDPFGIYHWGQPGDWIRSRPELYELLSVHKTHAVETAHADILLLGNSQTNEGMDPSCKVLPGPTYNLAIDGSHVRENFLELQHASFFHVPKTVVLVIDIYMFDREAHLIHGFEEDRLAVKPDGQPNPFYQFADLDRTLFSLSALRKTYQTWKDRALPASTYINGFQEDVPVVVGHLDVPLEQSRANAVFLPNKPVRFSTQGNNQWDAFVKLVHFCASHHIQLLVAVQPVHAILQHRLMENRDDYATWLRDVTHTLGTESGLTSELWDFSGYNDLTTEPFPKPTERVSHTQYYWNVAHYKARVGDWVLEKLFAHEGLPGFGFRVTQDTVEQDLDRLYREKSAYDKGEPLPSVSQPFAN